jgi:hypothetical protein
MDQTKGMAKFVNNFFREPFKKQFVIGFYTIPLVA